MIVVTTKQQKTYRFSPAHAKAVFPRLRLANIVTVTVSGTSLLISKKIFKGVPTTKGMDETIYPGDMAKFVWLNLKNYFSRTRTIDGLKKFIDNQNAE